MKPTTLLVVCLALSSATLASASEGAFALRLVEVFSSREGFALLSDTIAGRALSQRILGAPVKSLQDVERFAKIAGKNEKTAQELLDRSRSVIDTFKSPTGMDSTRFAIDRLNLLAENGLSSEAVFSRRSTPVGKIKFVKPESQSTQYLQMKSRFLSGDANSLAGKLEAFTVSEAPYSALNIEPWKDPEISIRTYAQEVAADAQNIRKLVSELSSNLRLEGATEMNVQAVKLVRKELFNRIDSYRLYRSEITDYNNINYYANTRYPHELEEVVTLNFRNTWVSLQASQTEVLKLAQEFHVFN